MLGKKKAAGGAPEWALTYGDMMSLLLCFFILLSAFANFDNNTSKSMTAAIRSMQEALGLKVAGNRLDDQIDYNALIEKIQQALKTGNNRFKGDTDQAGIAGDSFRLRRIRDGMEITLGGPILFDSLSAELTDEGRQALDQIGAHLQGHRNKIEVCGHAADRPRPSDWTFRDAWALSYERACRVAEELVRKGVDVRTIRIVAVGDTEPVVKRKGEPARPGDNRRVEIVVRESMMDDFANTLAPAADTPATQPSLPKQAPAAASPAVP